MEPLIQQLLVMQLLQQLLPVCLFLSLLIVCLLLVCLSLVLPMFATQAAKKLAGIPGIPPQALAKDRRRRKARAGFRVALRDP